MADTLRIALVQLSPGLDVAANVAAAVQVVAESGPHADVVLLPENCLALGTNTEMRERALDLDSDEIGSLRAAAAAAGTVVVVGGFKRLTGEPRVRNTALVIAADGSIAGHYDKIHLFDAAVDGRAHRATDVEAPGDRPAILRVDGVEIGLTICFDVGFPTLHRRLAAAGARVILVPAAFTVRTGRAHWEVLLRARAIENGAFVVASATYGPDNPGFPSYGHALAVDPDGTVLADLAEKRCAWQVLDLDLAAADAARAALPVLPVDRQSAYTAEIDVIETARRMVPQ